jgi:hypothetical protein
MAEGQTRRAAFEDWWYAKINSGETPLDIAYGMHAEREKDAAPAPAEPKGYADLIHRLQYNKPFTTVEVLDALLALGAFDGISAEPKGEQPILFQDWYEWLSPQWRRVIEAIDHLAAAAQAEQHRALSGEEIDAIQQAADTAHRVLCAGGDYGDELSDAGLRRELTTSRDALRAVLATLDGGKHA